ncbi:hypothetical protein VE01_01890 [Pseudogymnoascus verrucosus]|uniref:Dihydroxyacetone kinase 2 n=1 Tax=Pseudogymnoascus verrucosus TaxID=342668 RepID=A0A1B8GW99_9PEZI|nr:uncharacterized protein VE01_01890 [Pseudogymnoascus verrucosus]OBU00123.1 hypothetical protein VE01_01890 [Pseudogymnoascus verrucosus]
MTLGKHFVNAVEDPVGQALKSFLRQDRSLRLIESQRVLYHQQNQQKVLLLSGGGSGHEPAHAGYLGGGMLDVCVSGDIFASPSASQVLAGLKALKSPKGILMIVKNYTGDKLNFGLAAEKAKSEGLEVNVVFVGDDVSVEGNELVGRRGLAGVAFVHKIAGAMASRGSSLEEVTQVAQSVSDRMVTAGVSLDRCSVPKRGKQESLPFNLLEYGMGIHNEPGTRREKIPSMPSTVANVLEILKISELDKGKPIATMINNLGGLSILELHIIANEVMGQLEAVGFDIRRTLVGTFVSSLNGPGFSVTILELDPLTESLLNDQTTAPAWPNITGSPALGIAENTNQRLVNDSVLAKASPIHIEYAIQEDLIGTEILHTLLGFVLKSVVTDEPMITRYDTIAGDGDCGETLLKGVKSVCAALLQTSSEAPMDIVSIFRVISNTIESSMGGTSGAIYAIFFNAVTNHLSSPFDGSDPGFLSMRIRLALNSGVAQLCRYTSARKGHKTLMDALIPFTEAFASGSSLEAAVMEARNGAEATRKLDAVLGRASYVGKEIFEVEGGIPDPGAMGVVSVLQGILEGLKDERIISQ